MQLALVAGLYPMLCGFVLLSANKATLPVSPESPEINFIWDGEAPSIKDKGDFKGGVYADLDDHDFMEQLLLEAMAVWNQVPGAYVTLTVSEEEADGEAALDTEDQVFSIVTEHNSNVSSAAYARPFMEKDAPRTIADCDIAIADHAEEARNLAFTIAHELGHCLGLGHAHTNYNAIMSYSRNARTLKLGADDVAGLIYLYPDPDYVPDEPKEIVCGAIGGIRRDGQSAGTWTLMLLLAAPLALAALTAGRQQPRPARVAARAKTS